MNYAISAAESLNAAVAGVLTRMTTGVGATFLVASLLAASGIVPALFGGILGYVLIFAPLVFSLLIAFRAETMSKSALQACFYAFAATMGVSLSLLFHAFTTASIVGALFATTISFGALAGWGYFTKRDLSSWGPYLFAGVIGLIITSIVGIFIGSSTLQMVINSLAVIIFLGLTAYDMNRIRDMFWNTANEEEIGRLQWLGALSLYINFINIFTSLLQLFGSKEE